ncbi:retroviral-like aspartic protease family protein [Undibacterium flavidum]|uniref:Aspartyl protease family protein n=1 Tax=Undibacterium flavidum TaxID=2762297 RepID=A0ABR6Y8C9_9BURK|nr:retroviral-like aspartic protease family protein [Undibacterium flavidum]MBC3872866.1 aspartyl protease family protein [Undibacterium flavidum]
MQKLRQQLPIILAFITLLSSTTNTFAQDAPKRCRYINSTKLQIELTNQQAFVIGSVNQKAAKLLVDTGSYNTVIGYNFAKKNELVLAHTDTISYGIGGETREYKTKLQEFSIGTIKGGQTLLKVGSENATETYDGLIGADFLYQSDLEIAVNQGVLRFFTPQNCENSYLAYWDKNANEVDLELGYKYDARPSFFVTINGQRVRTILDTGAQATIINEETARSLGMKFSTLSQHQGSAVGIGKRTMKIQAASFEKFQIGEELIENAMISVGDLWANSKLDKTSPEITSHLKDSAQLILGMDFIREHRILVALSQRKIYMSYLGGPLFMSAEKDN